MFLFSNTILDMLWTGASQLRYVPSAVFILRRTDFQIAPLLLLVHIGSLHVAQLPVYQ